MAAAEPPVPSLLKVSRVLAENADARSVTILGEDSHGRRTIAVLSKPPFTAEEAAAVLSDDNRAACDEVHRNDRFSAHELRVPPRHNRVACQLICPANEHDVSKYSPQTRHLVRETRALYEGVTRPFVAALLVPLGTEVG